MPWGRSSGTLSDTVAPILTVGVNSIEYIKGILLENTHTAPVTVDLHLVGNNSGAVGTASDSNKLVPVLLEANDHFIYELPMAIDGNAENDTIQGKADVDAVVNYWVVGKEVSTV